MMGMQQQQQQQQQTTSMGLNMRRLIEEGKVCRYFQEGHCPFENCKFPHVSGKADSPKLSPTTEIKICRYFQQGHCPFEHCRFRHVKAEESVDLKISESAFNDEESQLKNVILEQVEDNNISFMNSIPELG